MELDLNQLADPVAERATLAAAFRHGVDGFLDVDDLVTDRSFTIDSNRIIFRCLRHLFEQDSQCRPDTTLVLSAAASLGLNEQIGTSEELKHLRAISQMPIELPNVRKLAAKVRKLEVARTGLEVNDQIRSGLLGVTGDEPIGEIVSLLERPVFDFASSLSQTDDTNPKRLGEDLELWLEYLAANPVDQVGLPTGMPYLDMAMGGGMTDGSITLIGARSGIGKTFVGNKIGLNTAAGSHYSWPKFNVTDPVPVLYLDTELRKEDHNLRSVSCLSGVPMNLIKTGKFGANTAFAQKARDATALLKDIPYDFRSIAGQPFEETLGVMRRWISRTVGLRSGGKANPCLIVFDYVKLMDASGLSKQVAEFQALGFIMTGLHNFGVRYGIPILAFCQLNRDGINDEETNAIGGSDRLLWLASSVWIYKPQNDDEIGDQHGRRPTYNFKLVPLKNRHGPGLARRDYINVLAELDRARIVEGPPQSILKKSDPQSGFDTGDMDETQ